MLFLLLYLESDCYALDANHVVEILPLVGIKQLQSPQRIVGTINYHGTFVPVVDFSELILGRRASARLSTRILLLRCLGDGEPARLLGLIGEKATETMRCEPTDFVSAGITNDDAPYLGAIATRPQGLVQRIEVNKLLSVVLGELVCELTGQTS